MGSLTGMAETGLAALARVEPGQELGTDEPRHVGAVAQSGGDLAAGTADSAQATDALGHRGRGGRGRTAQPTGDLAICTPKLPIPTLKYGRPSVL